MSQELRLKAEPIMVGSLASNQLALQEPGVEPIHCLVEPDGDGGWRVTDLGSLAGVRVNGTHVEVEARVKAGDTLQVGSVTLVVVAGDDDKLVAVPAPSPTARANSRMLFSPKRERNSGPLLEVVAYWGDTVLNVDHFHPDLKGFDSVTIGDPTKAHFMSGGRDYYATRVLADVSADRCTVRLTGDMKVHARKDGKLRKVVGKDKLTLGARDFAHIQHGPIRYFLHYAAQPKVELPVARRDDKLFMGLGALFTVMYLALVTIAVTITPAPKKLLTDDEIKVLNKPWQEVIVKLPPPPKEPVKPIEKPKPRVDLTIKPTTVKEQPKPKDPPKPLVKPEQPKPLVHEMLKPIPKPEAPKPIVKPTVVKETVKQPQVAGTQTAPVTKPATPTNPAPAKPPGAPSTVAKPVGLAGTQKPLVGTSKPNLRVGATGGLGQTKPTIAGSLKGQTKENRPGVEGGTRPTSGFVNLSQLGNQAGRVLTKPGGISVAFRDSAGGMSAQSGSSAKGYNIGDGGNRSGPLAVGGTGDSLAGFGRGTGGPFSGQDGIAGAFRRGNGGTGPNGGFGKDGPGGIGTGVGTPGHGRVNVNVADNGIPLVDGGLRSEEIMTVIRRHLNEIRHCYEQLLQRSPSASGRVKVAFQIVRPGRTANTRIVESTLNDSVFKSCIVGKISRWNDFPNPRGDKPVDVTYPFSFSPL